MRFSSIARLRSLSARGLLGPRPAPRYIAPEDRPAALARALETVDRMARDPWLATPAGKQARAAARRIADREAARAADVAPIAPNPDPCEQAGYTPESLESRRLELED